MGIAISFDPTDASDVEWVQDLLSTPDEAPAPATKTKSKAKAAPEPEPEEESTGPTLQDAVDRATELVSDGRAADVKGALANFGVKRVSELEESQVAEFIEALEGDGVV